MEKKDCINKSLLCAENIANSASYENFSMQILSRSKKGTNVFALTCDTAKLNLINIVALNLGYNLAVHDKKVLIINLDCLNTAFNDLLVVHNDNDNVVNYGNVDILLPKSTDLIGEMEGSDLQNKYSDYDFVILCVPSPKKKDNYLAVPENTDYYILVSKFISSFYSINKCIVKIDEAKSNVLGSVYIKLK